MLSRKGHLTRYRSLKTCYNNIAESIGWGNVAMRYSSIGFGGLITMSLILSGCATVSDYWRKPTKYKQMPESAEWAPPVATLSLDASRRLVISQQLNNSNDPRFTCPEPPPDVALNTLSQTLASVSTKAGNSAQIGSAFVAMAEALSSRTSTVEFWRTTSSTFCILLMNNRTSEAYAYLEAAKAGIGVTKDTMATLAAVGPWPNLAAEAAAFEEYAKKKQAEADEVANAASAKRKEADAEAAKSAQTKKE